VAAWVVFANAVTGAAVVRLPGLTAAVFPQGPERAVYNNAVLERGLPAVRRSQAVDALEAAYDAAGVDCFAAWVYERDPAMAAESEGRGYRLLETTRAMAMDLGDLRVPAQRCGSLRPDGPAMSI
jgi:hypothetical protein